jgi:F420-dependent oxidoreductase-like protein
MKLAALTGTTHTDWDDLASFALECERIGVDSLWSAEFFGHDAMTPLAYLAGQTSRIRLGTGVITMGARSPLAVAMASMSLASMSGGRFLLGLGLGSKASVEGLHGVPFDTPSRSLRETIEIVRRVAAGMPVAYSGRAHRVDPSLIGQPDLVCEPGANAQPFPMYVASLNPVTLRVTGELADGWVGGMSFMPEIAHEYFDYMAAGAARAGRTLADLDLMAPTFIGPADAEQALAIWKPVIAMVIGNAGAFKGGHHHGAYRRAGYADLCDAIHDAFEAGHPDEAAAMIPDEFVLQSKLAGDDAMVRARLRAYRDCGVTTLQIYSFAPRLTDELEALARLKALLDEVNAEVPVPAGG